MARSQRRDADQRRGQGGGDLRRCVGRRVVDDHDPPREREAVRQKAVQTQDRPGECALLVADGDDDVDLGSGQAREPIAPGRRKTGELGHVASIGDARYSELRAA
jgi:hypothetical protein